MNSINTTLATLFDMTLSDYRWYRRLRGGKWMQTLIDNPVSSRVWLRVPDSATINYREPLWRGTPKMEIWP